MPTIALKLSNSQQPTPVSPRGRRGASLGGALRLALALILGASASFAESLDVAEGYNLFAFNNINVSADVGGSVALGGQLKSATSIGSQLSVSSAFPSLVADGTNNSNVIANGVGTIDVNNGSAYLYGHSSSQPANVTFNQGGAGYMTGSEPVSGGIAGFAILLCQPCKYADQHHAQCHGLKWDHQHLGARCGHLCCELE